MEHEQIKEHVDLIREVFNYSHHFKGATFVIKIEHPILDHPLFPSLIKDLTLLHRMDIRIVIIPGAKTRIDEVLKRYDIDFETSMGVRISTEAAIPFIKMAAFDVSNKVMTTLAGNNENAVIGNWVRAKGLGVIKGKDFQYTGQVEKIDVDLVNKVLDEGLIPVFPCIGWNLMGKPYNISSNELASVVSIQLKADKLFFLSDYPEINNDHFLVPKEAHISPKGRISRLNTQSASEFLDLNESTDSQQLEYIRLAREVCANGVARVHILDGRIDGIILKEIFSNLGMGTMIHGNIYESIRQMKPKDVTDILRLMQPFIQKEILVRRTESELRDKYRDYVVYEMDGSVHGCGALHLFGEGMAEIAGLAVDQNFDHLGIGQKIVSFLLDAAKEQGVDKIFVMTTQTADWFERLGFKNGGITDIPKEKQGSYDQDRKSMIFIKNLSE